MSRDPVSEVDAPWQPCGDAVRSVFEPREEAADAANRDADREWNREQITRRDPDAQALLRPLNGGQAADQASHDGFAAE